MSDRDEFEKWYSQEGDSADHYNVLRDLVDCNQPPKDNTQEGE